MKKIILVLTSLCIVPALSFGADSASNRADQTIRLGTKGGLHIFYILSQPYMLELPGKDWTFGVAAGSGGWSQDVTTSSGTSSYKWTVTSQELNARYYVGNSFNILLGYGSYGFKVEDYPILSSYTYDITYNQTQINVGIGNEWTYDWGGFFGIDWFQTGSKMSDKYEIKIKSGSETAASKAAANEVDTLAISGALVFNFGFGF